MPGVYLFLIESPKLPLDSSLGLGVYFGYIFYESFRLEFFGSAGFCYLGALLVVVGAAVYGLYYYGGGYDLPNELFIGSTTLTALMPILFLTLSNIGLIVYDTAGFKSVNTA